MRHTINRFGPLITGDATLFRVWAPSAPAVALVLKGNPSPLPMRRGEDGVWSVNAPGGEGLRYRFRVGTRDVADLASRHQDGRTDGWSIVRAPLPPLPPFDRPWHEMIICEVHVGTATPEGTFDGLAARLEHFRDAGFTCLELMPVNACPGERNWGYDGTLIFAPQPNYGSPRQLRALVARAHEFGLTMILDVVYNHFGSIGNVAHQTVPQWFDSEIATPWGPGLDFDSSVVREFFYENALMWLDEYGFDGLRFDAVHEIKSAHKDKFLGELAARLRAVKPNAKLVLENMNNAMHWLERNLDNIPMTYTAQWNEDMHNVLAYIVTGEADKTGYGGAGKDPIADLEKALADGFVHDPGEGRDSDGHVRGGPASRLPPDSFVTYVENHDQIGNRADGKRLSARITPEQMDFLHFVKFLAPQIPLCFMGDEANIDSPFPFFVDFDEQAGDAADARRYDEMERMFNEHVEPGELPHPNDQHTFEMAKLPWADYAAPRHAAAMARFAQLIGFRRQLLWPLAATPCRDAATERHGEIIVVRWIFAAGRLTMALNPTAAPASLPLRSGEDFVSTGRVTCLDGTVTLGPWSALAWRH